MDMHACMYGDFFIFQASMTLFNFQFQNSKH